MDDKYEKNNETVDPNNLKEGLDYYIEDENFVFTAHYLKTRPCCEKGCRHCPYGFNEK